MGAEARKAQGDDGFERESTQRGLVCEPPNVRVESLGWMRVMERPGGSVWCGNWLINSTV
jgi:hypothetical protein